MALVLNGSANTIGGLAVGGVPDGTIDAGAIATNAITASELAANAVETGHLHSGLALGKLIQLVEKTTTTQYTTTSDSWQHVANFDQDVTTGSAASRILIICNPFVGARSVDGKDAYTRYKIARITGGTEVDLREGMFGAWMGNQSGQTHNHYAAPLITYKDEAVAASTTYTYKFYYRLHDSNSSTQAQFNPHSGMGGSYWQFIEVLD
tara:strand:- start:136 stop:759 length:624 start_codon:yes stop_codon:yes gene_type:complete